jgi:predicted ATP-dependent endonuclease of OLD family
VLIDELELALHPFSQIALYELLDTLSRNNRLTIIVSTHSVSLIRAVKQSRLLLLERAANVTCPGNFVTVRHSHLPSAAEAFDA